MEETIFKTKRLKFGKWSFQKISEAKVLWCDPEVTRFIGGRMSDNDIMNRLKIEVNNETQYGVQYWPIYLIGTNELVGCCGLRPYLLEDKTYEIGFHISSKFWRQGFAFEASREVIQYAFNKLDCCRLFAGHNPENKGSSKLLLKLGFKYSHDEFYPPTGLNHPSYYFEKADYNNFR